MTPEPFYAGLFAAVLRADHALFQALNGAQGSPFFDALFYYGTELGNAWLPALLAMAALFALHGKRALRSVVLALPLGLVLGLVGLSLKLFFARARPVGVLGETVKVLGPTLVANSFPSGHALSAGIILGLLWVVDRRLSWVWLPFVVLVCLSRVYLGAHFPSDVVVGSLLGFFSARGLARKLRLSLGTSSGKSLGGS